MDVLGKLLVDIKDELVDEIGNNDKLELGLYSGQSGMLLYLFEYALLFDDNKVLNLVNIKVNSILERLSYFLRSNGHGINFCMGYTGLAWFINHINQRTDYDKEFSDDLLKGVAPIIESECPLEIEIVRGLAGYGCFTSTAIPTEFGKKINSTILERIMDRSSIVNQSRFWVQPRSSFFKLYKDDDREVNLGFAHGNLSLIKLVSEILNTYPSLQTTQLNQDFQQSIDFLVGSFIRESDGSVFLPNDTKSTKRSRFAWCYGDIGSLATLKSLYSFAQDQTVKKLYREVIESTLKRNFESLYMFDCGLCHGMAGVELVYGYEDLLTTELIDKLEAFKCHWRDEILKGYEAHGISYLYKYELLSQSKERNLGFLNGLAGIGLSLLTPLSNSHEWKKALFV